MCQTSGTFSCHAGTGANGIANGCYPHEVCSAPLRLCASGVVGGGNHACRCETFNENDESVPLSPVLLTHKTMELLDTRCVECRNKFYQCSKCQKSDNAERKNQKKRPKTADLTSVTPTGSSLVHLIPDDVAQLTKAEVDAVFQKRPGTSSAHRMLSLSHPFTPHTLRSAQSEVATGHCCPLTFCCSCFQSY
jgi:hypothetical protein